MIATSNFILILYVTKLYQRYNIILSQYCYFFVVGVKYSCMNVVQYLKDIYGYATPIFLKDIRIGRKSKTAIRKELSRAVKSGEIIRRSQGIYYFKENDIFSPELSFQDIVTQKYIKDDYGIPGLDLEIYGYYSGQTFLHMIGLSQQVPAVLEITTNNTSCKRVFHSGKYQAIIRKGRTEINRINYRILQFLDMLSSTMSEEEIKENKDFLKEYINKNFTKKQFTEYIGFYSFRLLKIMTEEGLLNAFR